MRTILKYCNGIFVLMVFCFLVMAAIPSYADLIIDPYGPGSGIAVRNTNVRWLDEPDYKPYPGNPGGVSKQKNDFTIVSADFEGCSYDIKVSQVISNNPDEAEYMKEGRYLLRDDISADVDLYFDMLSSNLFLVENDEHVDIDLKDKKLIITLEMGNFDERITSDRKLMVVRSFYTDEQGGHYYIPADETIVDIPHKRIYATISDLPNALKIGPDGIKDVMKGTTKRTLDIMFGYVASGTKDLMPKPIEHVSSSDVVSGDDTMGVIVSDIPSDISTDLVIKQDDGTYTLDTEKVKENLPEFEGGKMIAIPAFTADVNPESIAIITQSITVNALKEKKFEYINVLKARKDGTVCKLNWAESPAAVGDGEYYISEKRTGVILDKEERPDPGKQYVLYMGIKDNGDYDLDSRVGVILDPAVMAIHKDSDDDSSKDSSGGGGCNALGGFIALTATALLFIYYKRKR
ncbi:hypothetical protein [Cloacibacillus porcorum]|uniref:hypothetical protein n=1 Tax=Cloacibacillus porcorum TaxID=1197717 RepID=UPI0023EFC44D|nr:hypothetical protein [Cloacibacillus porcorum]MDD7649047.1 hypothetical protein [Cloacibacillus porcorum]MDY4094548.1 hypothetical protein [Cloacibacillus porcorum]